MRYNQLNRDRILSLDAFRGITILVMIFVNELAGIRDIPYWMKHMPREADAMSFVDVVFPAFLFIVGMSIPFAINSRLAKGNSFLELQMHIAFRTLGLLVLGFFMVNAESGYDEHATGISINLWSLLFFLGVILIWKVYRTKNKVLVYLLKGVGCILLLILALLYRGKDGARMSPHWWGILGLIGWAYFFACLFYQLFRGNKYGLLLMVGVCVGFFVIGQMPAVEGSSFLSWIHDRFRDASHTSIVLCGIICSLIFFDEKKQRPQTARLAEALVFVTILFIAGYFLRPWYKISKIYATPTWSLYSSAFCVIIFSFLHWLVDNRKVQAWVGFFRPAASNPLLTYILPDIIYYLTALTGISLFPSHLRYGWPGGFWSVFFAIAVMGLVVILNKLKLRLQL